MTVSTEVDHNEYTGNGVTTSFPYTFRIFKKSDLVVQVSDLNGNVTKLVLDAGYTVTGAGTYSGGAVVLPSPLAAGWRITIERVLDVVQETDLRNQGKFFPEVHEDAFDYLTMLIQRCFGWFRRALMKPSLLAKYYDAKQNRISNLADPSLEQDAVNNRSMRNYVDAAIAGVVGGFGWFIQYGSGAVYRTLQDKMRDGVSIKDFGAQNGILNDNKEAFTKSLHSFSSVFVPEGVFNTSLVSLSRCGLYGTGGGTIKQYDRDGNHLVFNMPDGGMLSTLTIMGNKSDDSVQGHQVSFSGGHDVSVKNIRFTNTRGTGFSLIAYPNNGIPSGYIVRDIRGEYLGFANNKKAGCVLFDSSQNTLIDGVIARNYPQFGAVELKTAAKYNIVSNVIGEECQHVVYNGTETETAPTNNIISSVMANNPKYAAVVVGKGTGNLISNVLVDYSESDAKQAHGVTVQGNNNIASNILMTGCDGKNESGDLQTSTTIRFLDAACSNYASIFPMYSSSGVVTFEEGCIRNFVEIKHPGDRNNILSSASAVTGISSIDGTTNSNVVHVPALGQYVGTMSGRFEWWVKYFNLANQTLVSADKFRMLAEGDVSLAVGGGISSQLKLFNSDNTKGTMSLINGNIRISTGNSEYIQFSDSAMTPSTTNTYSLGLAGRAWSGGFTQSAFTVLSDARFKTAPEVIDEKILDAWERVEWVSYQYLDRIEVKGKDGARWHFGAVAQHVISVFQNEGIDVSRLAFICYDKWNETPAEYRDVTEEEHSAGVYPLIQTKVLVREAVEAGECYGIRYEEALILESAMMRRRVKKLEEQVLQLTGN
ncbi:TPA: phage tail protein [Escherichia coli]|nr:phage tail protein [Escherichia coli]